MKPSVDDKYQNLLARLSTLDQVVIAFSGGADSTFLLFAACAALGRRALAITISTPYMAQWEIKEAVDLAQKLGAAHQVASMPFLESLRRNPANHCYLCKQALFSRLLDLAHGRGIDHVADGTNADDLNDYRPGLAALKELGVHSPLLAAGMTKPDIRCLSQKFGLPTWNKPAYACLLSRIPVNTQVTEDTLRRIERAERFLFELGFGGARVRTHGDLARIEIAPDQIRALIDAEQSHAISAKLKKMGYRHVAVELSGYQTGSMNSAPETNGENDGQPASD